MGAWGPGNFDNDAAGDFQDDVISKFVHNIEKALQIGRLNPDTFDLDDHGDGLLMPSLDLIATVCRYYEITPSVSEDTIRSWKKQYLDIFDKIINEYGPSEEYKRERRIVIVDTFDQLIKLARQYPP